jgi:hypothetical protein
MTTGTMLNQAADMPMEGRKCPSPAINDPRTATVLSDRPATRITIPWPSSTKAVQAESTQARGEQLGLCSVHPRMAVACSGDGVDGVDGSKYAKKTKHV